MTVRTSIADGVCEIRLDRPAKRNAITPAMWEELNTALDRVERDDGIRAVLFTGAGQSFCAGADLGAFSAESLEAGVPEGLDNPGGRVTVRLPHVDKVMVAAVQGHAVGFGTSLALQCDYVLTSPDARFAMPFVERGFVPEGGSSLCLPQRIGYLRAARMMLAGEAIDGPTACEWGLATRLVDASALLDDARSLAARIASLPEGALRRTRQLMRTPSRDIDDQLRREAEAFSAQLRSPEVRDRIAAFESRRR